MSDVSEVGSMYPLFLLFFNKSKEFKDSPLSKVLLWILLGHGILLAVSYVDFESGILLWMFVQSMFACVFCSQVDYFRIYAKDSYQFTSKSLPRIFLVSSFWLNSLLFAMGIMSLFDVFLPELASLQENRVFIMVGSGIPFDFAYFLFFHFYK